MKLGSYLVNAARGPLVKEDEVADALRAGKIHYATDVLVDEWSRPTHLYDAAAEGGVIFYASEHVASNDVRPRDVLNTG